MPKSPFRATSPASQPTRNSTPAEHGSHQPKPITPMLNPAQFTTCLQVVPKPASEQSDTWRRFGTALKTLEAITGVFPPLKEVLSVLSACTMEIKIAEQNRGPYDQLALDLVDLVQILQKHLPEAKPRWMPYSIENAARAIGEQVIHIQQKQNDWKLGQVVRASDNEMDILGCYQRIEHVFRHLQVDISLSIWDLTHMTWVNSQLKDLTPVHEAWYNAALSVEMQRHGCAPNTRVRILSEAMEWARKPDSPKLYWMNGMAGTGKTTIAYSLCEQLEKSKQLGACFFCSRFSPDCRNMNRVVPTIAYQLGRFSNPYQKELCEVLGNNPDVAKRKISVQFEKLLVGPLSKIKDAMPKDVIVVIDALDECDDGQGAQLVLDLLFSYAAMLPVRFFVSNRPEPGILHSVQSFEQISRFILHLHEVDESFVEADIHTYLEQELREAGAQPEEIKLLAVRSGCLFIYAATVIRYIEPKSRAVNHKKRLATIIMATSETLGETHRGLDELYSAILLQAFQKLKGDEGETLRSLLHVVIGARESLAVATLAELASIESENEVQLALLPLLSVLNVSANTRVVSTLHASFPDFMLSSERSKEFCCDITKQSVYMAAQCFRIMQRSLRFNICNLETSSRFDKDIPSLQARIDESISSGLFYACRYWGSHLHDSILVDELIEMLDDFLRYRLPLWMEVLSLTNYIGDCSDILLEALKYIPFNDSFTELRAMVQDSRSFASKYAANPASYSTPHIYLSALPLTSAKSRVREVYWPRTKGLATVGSCMHKDRMSSSLAAWATGSVVNKIALSNDGKRIVAGGENGTISVWNVNTGRCILGPLKKHKDSVFAVTFSPDGGMIASGSNDRKIYLSSAYTGDTLVGPLEGHSGAVCYLSFSPDGLFLASASEDHTIRIWNPVTGDKVGSELKGHTECVMCVVFSVRGDRLISCSDDRTIRIWDRRTSAAIGKPLEGHTDWVDCVALSPDDMHIASSSCDHTVRIWNLKRMETVIGPLIGHTGRVASVAYSSDGKSIVSGSFDRTIRVWSAETGDLIAGPFTGHEASVYSVMFSIDGTQILSGSLDQTICVWDAYPTGAEPSESMEGDNGAIISISVSPDGSRVVSGSGDGTVCVWDLQTGRLALGPLKGHNHWVWSVIYTPDGTFIISCSNDGTICTWDAQTGSKVKKPFNDAIVAAVSPDSRLIASGSLDFSVRVWELQSGNPIGKPLVQHTAPVCSVEFSSDGFRIVSGSDDMTICAWDVLKGTLIWTCKEHVSEVTGAKFLPSDQKVLSCSFDGTLLLLDPNTGIAVSNPWEGHNNAVRDIAISPDGTMAASGSRDRTIGLWNVQTGTLLAPLLQGHTGDVSSVAFSLDGKHVISGSYDGTVRVWNIGDAIEMKEKVARSWVVKGDGWIMGPESELVLWLPPDLAARFLAPPCSGIIHAHGPVPIELGEAIYGNGWARCFDASAESYVLDT
ncbi:WD domain, G-beta repeat [Rhizoctonia solani]|uniref:WD domain, G-beta repeat n=1 Tax=Rhizoctonia solani TaxID=456999 RepID=A0A8H7H044_9AGAM|nr:WD domain, G-beta repeat [Rhizoctonia solani]